MKAAFKMPERKAIDDWVDGAGTAAAVAAPTPPGPKVKLARLTIDLDAELHAQFKAACAIQRTRMIDEVRGFIEGFVQKGG